MTDGNELPGDAARVWLRRVWVVLSVSIVVLALINVLRDGFAGARIAPWDLAVLALLTSGIAIGAALPIRMSHANSVTPLATASAVALVFASCRPSQALTGYTSSIAILGAGVGYTAGVCMRRMSGQTRRRPILVAVPMVTVGAMAVLYRWAPLWDGATFLQMYQQWDSERWKAVSVMAVMAALPLLVELFLVGFLVSPVRSMRSYVADLLRVIGPIYAAAASTGIAIAVGLEVLSLWALPLIALPLLLARSALSRTFDGQHERQQSMAALSTITEVAGYTRVGHSARVSALAQQVGRQLNLSDRELTLLTDAALLHDIGQVSLSEPIPGGATIEAAPLDQLSIAAEGGAILRRSGVLDEVAAIVESQAVQYRQVREFGEDVPLSSRIIKVCNAFDDLSRGERARANAAFERLSLGLGYEYDPSVVTALQRIYSRLEPAHGKSDRVHRSAR